MVMWCVLLCILSRSCQHVWCQGCVFNSLWKSNYYTYNWILLHLSLLKGWQLYTEEELTLILILCISDDCNCTSLQQSAWVNTHFPSLSSSTCRISICSTAWDREESGLTPLVPRLRTELPYCSTWSVIIKTNEKRLYLCITIMNMFLCPLFLKSFPTYFHVSQSLTKDHPSPKPTFSSVFPYIFPCKSISHQGPLLV